MADLQAEFDAEPEDLQAAFDAEPEGESAPIPAKPAYGASNIVKQAGQTVGSGRAPEGDSQPLPDVGESTDIGGNILAGVTGLAHRVTPIIAGGLNALSKNPWAAGQQPQWSDVARPLELPGKMVDAYREGRDELKRGQEALAKTYPIPTGVSRAAGDLAAMHLAGPGVLAQSALGAGQAALGTEADFTRPSMETAKRAAADIGGGAATGGMFAKGAQMIPRTTAAIGTGMAAGDAIGSAASGDYAGAVEAATYGLAGAKGLGRSEPYGAREIPGKIEAANRGVSERQRAALEAQAQRINANVSRAAREQGQEVKGAALDDLRAFAAQRQKDIIAAQQALNERRGALQSSADEGAKEKIRLQNELAAKNAVNKAENDQMRIQAERNKIARLEMKRYVDEAAAKWDAEVANAKTQADRAIAEKKAELAQRAAVEKLRAKHEAEGKRIKAALMDPAKDAAGTYAQLFRGAASWFANEKAMVDLGYGELDPSLNALRQQVADIHARNADRSLADVKKAIELGFEGFEKYHNAKEAERLAGGAKDVERVVKPFDQAAAEKQVAEQAAAKAKAKADEKAALDAAVPADVRAVLESQRPEMPSDLPDQIAERKRVLAKMEAPKDPLNKDVIQQYARDEAAKRIAQRQGVRSGMADLQQMRVDERLRKLDTPRPEAPEVPEKGWTPLSEELGAGSLVKSEADLLREGGEHVTSGYDLLAGTGTPYDKNIGKQYFAEIRPERPKLRAAGRAVAGALPGALTANPLAAIMGAVAMGKMAPKAAEKVLHSKWLSVGADGKYVHPAEAAYILGEAKKYAATKAPSRVGQVGAMAGAQATREDIIRWLMGKREKEAAK